MSQIKNAQIRYRIIDKCIRNPYKPFPSKEELRAACEENLYGSSEKENICDSTIEKDLFAMRMEHDAPIKYSKKNKGYYYEDEDYSIDDIPLTQDDIESIKFAVNTLSQFRESEIFKQFGFAIDKIFDRVNISQNPMSTDLDNFVQFQETLATSGNEFLPLLLAAIREKKIIAFDYESFISAQKKTRRCIPLLLKEYDNRWYCITFDFSKNAIITFALERMSDLSILDEQSDIHIEFDAKSFFEHAVGITGNIGEPVIVKFQANTVAAKYIQSKPFHKSQRLALQDKDFSIFELKVLLSEELIRNLLSFSHEIEVLEPSELRNTLRDRAQKMNNIYQ